MIVQRPELHLSAYTEINSHTVGNSEMRLCARSILASHQKETRLENHTYVLIGLRVSKDEWQ